MVLAPFPFVMLEVQSLYSLPILRQFPSSRLGALGLFSRSRYSKGFLVEILRTALAAYL